MRQTVSNTHIDAPFICNGFDLTCCCVALEVNETHTFAMQNAHLACKNQEIKCFGAVAVWRRPATWQWHGCYPQKSRGSQAQLYIDGRNTPLGTFDTQEEAARAAAARCCAARSQPGKTWPPDWSRRSGSAPCVKEISCLFRMTGGTASATRRRFRGGCPFSTAAGTKASRTLL